MNIEDLTLKQIKEIQSLVGSKNDNQYWEIGKNYMIRTVTMIDIGTLVAVTDHEFVLRDASWIADTGRFNEFLKYGTFNECEPFPDGICFVGRGSLEDACIWNHPLPRVVK